MARLTSVNGFPQEFAHDNFPTWMFWARLVQFFLALLELGLNGFVVSKQNLIGFSSFTGLTMFTACATLIAIPYVVVSPKYARNFYHVYGETILEFLLAVFWLASFSALASWIGALDNWGVNFALAFSISNCQLVEQEEDMGGFCQQLKNVKTAQQVTKAAVVFGAVEFVITLANFIFLVAYIFRSRKAAAGEAPAAVAATTDTEMGYTKEQPIQQTVTSMPPGFAGNETH